MHTTRTQKSVFVVSNRVFIDKGANALFCNTPRPKPTSSFTAYNFLPHKL